MDYSKLMKAIEAKNIPLKEFIPQSTKYGADGFRYSIKHNTLKVKTLEDISSALKIPMRYWWEESDSIQEPGGVYESSDDQQIKRLNRQIDNYLDEITRLKEENEQLRIQAGIRKAM